MVRGVGPRVPLRRPRAIDPQFAKDQLVLMLREWYMHPNGQIPGLRVGLRRRESAGPRVGGVARLPDRARRRPGDRDFAFPRARLPQAAAQLRLVGQPQGRARQQHLPGRIPGPRQHRHLRPQHAAADRMDPRPGRRHELDGDVLPQHAGHRAPARRPRIRSTRTSRASSGSTSSTSPTRSSVPTSRRRASGTRRTGSSTTRCTRPTARNIPIKVRSAVGLLPADRRRDGRLEADRPLPGLPPPHGVVRRQPAGPDRVLRLDDDARSGAAGSCSPSSSRTS